MNHVCFTTQITLTMIKLDNPNNINHDKSGSSCFTLSRFSPTDCYLSPFLHSNWLNDSVFKSCLANSSNKVKYVAKWNKTPVLIPSPGFRAATAAKDAKDWSLPSLGSHLNQIMPTLYWGSTWLAKIRRGSSVRSVNLESKF